METKEQLVNTIKLWIKIDNEIKQLQKEMKKRNENKKKISKELMEVMQTNQIDCFDLKNETIVYSKKNVKKPINQKMLLNVLSEYYEGDILKATEMKNYINEHREIKTCENIVKKSLSKKKKTEETTEEVTHDT